MQVMSIGLAVTLITLFPSYSAQARTAWTTILPKQSSDTMCGYASVAALVNLVHAARCMKDMTYAQSARFWNTVPCLQDETLQKRTRIPPPLSLKDMQHILEIYGISTSARQLDKRFLSGLLQSHGQDIAPYILHLGTQSGSDSTMPGHFVVILGNIAPSGMLLLFDPAEGFVVSDPARLEAAGSGYALLIREHDNSREGMKILTHRLAAAVRLDITKEGSSAW